MPEIRIEIVEDERIQARAMAGELEAMGYSVCAVAGTGQAAIAKAMETRPDLVLMDIRLPGPLDGIEAADRIRRSLDIPVVFVTAFSDAATLERAKISGPLGYVLKPAQSSELRTAIEVALHNHTAARRLRESEARYRGLFEGVPIGLYRVSPEPRILEANPALVRILGYPDRETLLSVAPTQLLRDLSDLPKLVASLASSPDQASVDIPLQRLDGSTIWARVRPRPVFDAAGQVVHYEGSLEDITARKAAEDEAQRSAAHARSLASTAALLNEDLDLDVVLQTICDATARATNSPAASVLLYDEAGDALLPAASCGHPAAALPGAHPVPRRRYYAHAGPDDSYFLIPDASALHGKVLSGPSATMDLRTVLGASIIHHGRLLGALLIFSIGEPRAFTDEDIALLKGLANQAAQALANARLYQTERSRVRQMAAINSLGRALSQTVDQERIFHQLAAATVELLPNTTTMAISLLDAESHQLTYAYVSANGEKLDAGALDAEALKPAGSGTRSDAVHKRGPVIIDDLGARHGKQLSAQFSGDGEARPRSGLFVPLMAQDRVVGVLETLSSQPARFTPADGELLALVANTGAVAIENARLVTQLQRELTARQQTMEALRASEEQHRTLFETMAQGAVYQDAAGAITSANPAAQRILGVTLDQMMGRTPGDPRWRPTREDGSPLPEAEHPSMIALKSGSEVSDVVIGIFNPRTADTAWINVHARPQYRPGESAPYQVYTTFEDITRRKRSEEALRHANHLLERTLAGLDEAVLVGDPASRKVAFCSPAVERTFGYQPEEVVGRPIDMLHVSSEAAAEFQRLRRAQGGADGISHLEYRMRRKDGSTFPSEHTVAPLSPTEGQPALVVTVIRDITQRKAQQRYLEGLVAVATALRRAHTVNEMVPAILEQVLSLLNADAAALSLLDPATGDSLVLLGLGAWSHRTGGRRPAGLGLTARVAFTKKTHVSPDIVAEMGEPEAAVFGDARSVACSPLIAENETIGALWLGRKPSGGQTQPILPGEVSLLEGIADMAATAIQRARLDQQTHERLQRLNALHTIDLAISGSMDLNITLGIILDEVISQLRVDAATVLSLDPPARSLYLAAARGLRSSALQSHTVRLGEGLPGQAALARDMVGGILQKNGADSSRQTALRGEGIVSQYCVPLISKGQVKGVLEVLHRTPLSPSQEWQDFLGAIGKQAAIAMENAELIDVLRRSNADLTLAYDSTLEGWSTALDMRDKEAVGHSRRVMNLAVELAEMLKMPEQEIVALRRGALLHDIGKLAIPDSILQKDGPLTDEEWAVVRRHPQNSHAMLQPIAYLRPSLDVVYSHHESWDGSGYPLGLKGEEIPFAARIFTIVNTWDALRTNRPYRGAMSLPDAEAYMRKHAGTRFDPRVLETFFEMLQQNGEA